MQIGAVMAKQLDCPGWKAVFDLNIISICFVFVLHTFNRGKDCYSTS